jgi:hypothetical protein
MDRKMDNKDVLIANLLDGWEGCHRMLNIYLAVAQESPGWLEKINQLLPDPAFARKSQEKFAAMRRAADSVQQGKTGLEVWRQVLLELHQPPPGSVQ